MPDFLSPGFFLGSGEALPQIHEEADQTIQGGAADEHFHITEDEHTWVAEFATRVFRYEPVCISTGETVHASLGADAGDILMGPVTGY